MPTEEWKPIPGFEEYEASSLGRIASVKRGQFRILTGGKTDTGYRNVLLYQGGIRSGHRVHRLVALTFLGPCPEGLEIRHLDGDKLNNALSNLAYGTHTENMQDRRRHEGRLLIVGRDPGWKPDRTHCRNGHEWVAESIYVYPNGLQVCRPCKTAGESESRRRRMQRAAGIEAAA